jgi:hypothetical protein
MQIDGEVLKISCEYGTLGEKIKVNMDLNKVTTSSFEAPSLELMCELHEPDNMIHDS